MTRKTVNVVFYRTTNGREPVKEWLLKLDKNDRSVIGTDLKTVEYGWPLGMPLVRGFSGKANSDLWEVRSDLSDSRIARIIFTMFRGDMVLLNGFIKKTQKTPDHELAKARDRKKNLV
ncbi:type II toxin-antitoxin system RelE/ParE family toxin [Marinobacter sp. ATCH36]|uniref:type II toxin-antitoxin system RelE/ParE family toxin n=1 Tax=Marinobacter sp. ATCH36 TaxID=2945106 RepID=UPI0020216CDA|nr:type II toxin-antitoxin system RelE/ParE family toxin [Marinobacter sp. ATCH36]MCL7943635.1 type II toxin-antitoxin system RelE/ParE family toxin [Marinobacter sp. ATCH36]